MSLPRPCCLTPFIIPGEPRGELEPDSSGRRIARYHARPSERVHPPDTAIVVFYDVFGFGLPNPKIQADEFADRLGVDVFVPDYLPDPPPIEPFIPITELKPGQIPTSGFGAWLRQLRTIWAYLHAMPDLLWVLDYWALPKAHLAVQELVAEGYTNIGAIGYCRGGGILMRLLADHTVGLTCGVICHPGPVDTRLFAKINVPTTWHLAQEDDYMKDPQIAALARVAETKRKQGISVEYTVHPETTHGFASRPNYDHPPSKVALDDVKERTVTFSRSQLGKTQIP